jgi:hypothetical protein
MNIVEVEGVDMVEEHYHPTNHRPEVKGINRKDSDMGEDMTIELKVDEREHVGVVLARQWTSDGAKKHWQARREWEEFTKLGCLESHTTFTSRTPIIRHRVECRRVKKRIEIG